VKANSDLFALPWAKSELGCLAVVPLGDFGPLPDHPPLIEAHTRPIADFDFHPFRRDVVVTSSVDSPVMLWRLPLAGDGSEGDEQDGVTGLRRSVRDPWQRLTDDSFVNTRVHHVSFHPLTNDLLITANVAGTMLLWDINHIASPKIQTSTRAKAVSLAWDNAGSVLAAVCKVCQMKRKWKKKIYQIRLIIFATTGQGSAVD
jgi:WD40 repeat protein